MAKALSKLAPGCQYLDLIEKADEHRPDDPAARHVILVAIVDRERRLVPNASANGVENRTRSASGRTDEELHILARAPLGQNRFDLGERALRVAPKRLGQTPRHEPQAENEGVDFVDVEIQWRKRQTWTQHIAEARFPFDRYALALECCDIAVKSAKANTKLVRQIGPSHRTPVAAQCLDQIEKTSRP